MHIVVRQGRFWLFMGMVGVIVGASLFAAGGAVESRVRASPVASTKTSPMASPSASPVATPVAAVTIDIAMMVFQTPSIEIPAGTTVTWVNKDVVAHTVTHRPEPGDALFDSGYLQPGESWSYTFGEEGIFDYYCIPHANMIGKVIVVAP